MSEAAPALTASEPAWKLEWLSPLRCRLILVLMLGIAFAARLWYLHHCPIDLGGDEAQYWDWSRNLDLSYYSKGPAVAYIIRASSAMFGETMQAVRYPSALLSALTSLVMYLLTRKLFGSERLALGSVLLLQILPLFIPGSFLMTIDPPMFFCWGLATYLAAIALFDDRPIVWGLVGLVIGAGFLAKYSTMLWFIGVFGFLIHTQLRSGPHRSGRIGALVALAIASMGAIPVLIWNQRHNWVSFRHVARQTGATAGAFNLGGVFEFFGGQILVVGPTSAILMIGAVVYVMRRRSSGNDPHRAKLLFLLWIGLSFFAVNLLASFRTKVQANWPAPTYFTLLILAAYFVSMKLRSIQTWRRWRGLLWITVLIGLIMIPLAHDTSPVLPLFEKIAKSINPKTDDIDPLARLRGWRTLGVFVAQELSALRPGAFVMCDDYQQTAEMAFYVPGQPKTYCAGSYFGKRLSQYDIWLDRNLDSSSPLVGRDAVYVGKGGALPGVVFNAFEEVEKLPELPIMVNGLTVRTFKVWRCRGFRGLTRVSSEIEY